MEHRFFHYKLTDAEQLRESFKNRSFNARFNLKDIFEARHALKAPLQFYGSRLDKIDPLYFKYMEEHERTALKEQLLYTFRILEADCELLVFEGDLRAASKRLKKLRRCAKLYNQLDSMPPFGEKKTCKQVLSDTLDDYEDKPAAYVALRLVAPLVAKTMFGIITVAEDLEDVRDEMTAANVHRLNWVWGGGFDREVLDLVPANIGNIQHTKAVLTAISPFTGYMSFVLYYFRLGINLYLLAKGTLKGSWMDPDRTEADKAVNLGIYERFQTQWQFRKFDILNDVFWATANMACFFWLIGQLANVGNALTALLLLMDLSLTAWGYVEKQTEHNTTMEQHKKDIDVLTAKFAKEDDPFKRKVLEEHLDVMLEARAQSEFEWNYTSKKFTYDLLYAAGLFASFSLLCCFFFPPAAILPATILILGLIGSALSLLFTIINHAMAISLEIEKIQASSANTAVRIERLRHEINQFASQYNATDDLVEKHAIVMRINGVRLKMSHLEKEMVHQEEMITYLENTRLEQIVSEITIPASAFMFLVFLPVGVGLLMLIPVVMLALMATQMLHKPEALEPPSVDDVPQMGNG